MSAMPAPYAAAPKGYASWGQRVGAALIDAIPAIVLYVIGLVLIRSIGFIFLLATFAFFVYNYIVLQGKTGQTIGKKVLGITLVKIETGLPIGPGMCFVRLFAHFLDSIFYIGYLWPLWDAKRQTFADKVMATYVLAS